MLVKVRKPVKPVNTKKLFYFVINTGSCFILLAVSFLITLLNDFYNVSIRI